MGYFVVRNLDIHGYSVRSKGFNRHVTEDFLTAGKGVKASVGGKSNVIDPVYDREQRTN